MLNIINHQGNTSQNHSEYHLTPVVKAIIKKRKKICAADDVEKMRPLYIADGNVGKLAYYSALQKEILEFPWWLSG